MVFGMYSATTTYMMVKPYTRFQSQGHIKKRPTVVESLMLIACLVVEVIQRWFCTFADRLCWEAPQCEPFCRLVNCGAKSHWACTQCPQSTIFEERVKPILVFEPSTRNGFASLLADRALNRAANAIHWRQTAGPEPPPPPHPHPHPHPAPPHLLLSKENK